MDHLLHLDVLNKASAYLAEKHIENSRLNAEMLLCRITGLSRVELYLHFEKPLSNGEVEQYRTLLKRRAGGEPLQYILEKSEFMSLTFSVNPHVLIPRPETETVVETIIESEKDSGSIRIMDIGTGSGNIAISLAHYLPHAVLIGTDASSEALDVARQNAEANHTEGRLNWIRADINDSGFVTSVGMDYDIIVSNPPYVTSDEWQNLPVEIRKYEPRMALDGGGDGLAFYRIIAKLANALLKQKGRLYFETGDNQTAAVADLLNENGFVEILTFNDLAGRPRGVKGLKDPGNS